MEPRRFDELVEAALVRSGSRYSLDYVYSRIQAGDVQVWLGENSVALTEIYGDRTKVLSVWLAAGDLDELLGILRDNEPWAREQGCEEIEATGRPGWQRVLDDYEVTQVTLRKRLTDGPEEADANG